MVAKLVGTILAGKTLIKIQSWKKKIQSWRGEYKKGEMHDSIIANLWKISIWSIRNQL